MAWRVIIEGRQLPNEENLMFHFMGKRPEEGQLRIIPTEGGVFVFRIEDVDYVPRKRHDVLVTRLPLGNIVPKRHHTIRQLVDQHNRILAGTLTPTTTRYCLGCREEYKAMSTMASICPNCGGIFVP